MWFIWLFPYHHIINGISRKRLFYRRLQTNISIFFIDNSCFWGCNLSDLHLEYQKMQLHCSLFRPPLALSENKLLYPGKKLLFPKSLSENNSVHYLMQNIYSSLPFQLDADKFDKRITGSVVWKKQYISLCSIIFKLGEY